LISEHAVYSRLGLDDQQRQLAYRALFSHAIADDDLSKLRRATQRGEPFGDERFTARVSEMLDRPVTKLTHGGDRKSQAFVAPEESTTLTP
jgi:putative transposase